MKKTLFGVGLLLLSLSYMSIPYTIPAKLTRLDLLTHWVGGMFGILVSLFFIFNVSKHENRQP